MNETVLETTDPKQLPWTTQYVDESWLGYMGNSGWYWRSPDGTGWGPFISVEHADAHARNVFEKKGTNNAAT